jgi:hypothetical protein
LSSRLQALAQEQSLNEEREAGTAKTQEETDLLKHPRPETAPLDTAGGIVNYDKNGGGVTPIAGPDGQPVMPYVKPGPYQHVVVTGPDGKPVFANYQDGKYLDAQGQEIPNAQPYEKPGAEAPHAINIDGKPGFGVVVPGKGWVDPSSGLPIQGHVTPIPPPPSYAQLMLPSKTATFIDPQTGLPTEQQWDPKTGTYDRPLGLSASNAYGHEAAQAGAVERAGTELIADLQANKARLGTLGAWVQKHGLDTPIADPTLAGIQSRLASFAALNPAMHGARGAQAMEHFEKIIGGLQQNPDATVEAIRGIMQTAGAINPNTPQGGGGASSGGGAKEPPRPAGAPANAKFNANGPKGPGWYW